jgi:hypothetical protein
MMAQPTPILYAGVVAQVIPCIAWALTRHRTRAAGALALGGAIGMLGDIVGRWMAHKFGNNHVTTYLDAPMMAVCFLAALREWQLTTQERRAFGIGIILFLMGCVGMVAFIEDVGTFNFGVGPLASLSFLAAGVWTLLRRTGAVERTPLHQTDWFWAALGLAIQGGATALASPLGGLLLQRGRIDLFQITWEIRAVFVLASYLLIGWGIYRGPAAPAFATDD